MLCKHTAFGNFIYSLVCTPQEIANYALHIQYVYYHQLSFVLDVLVSAYFHFHSYKMFFLCNYTMATVQNSILVLNFCHCLSCYVIATCLSISTCFNHRISLCFIFDCILKDKIAVFLCDLVI